MSEKTRFLRYYLGSIIFVGKQAIRLILDFFSTKLSFFCQPPVKPIINIDFPCYGKEKEDPERA